jgi:raffinose/stachyose/melibiose transport system substrate-binding protein
MKSSKWRSKRYLILGLLMLVAACSGESSPGTTVNGFEGEPSATTTGASPGEDVTLTVWWWGEPEAPGTGEWLQARADEYSASNPNVDFELVEQNIDTVITAFRAAASAQSGPDVAFVFSGNIYVMEEVWAGNLAAVSDYLPQEALDQMFDTGSKTFDGKIWTMPFYMQSYLMMYNRELFEQAGLDVDAPPATLDDLLDACGALQTAGFTPITTGLRDGFMGGIWYSEMGVQSLEGPRSIQQASIGGGSFTDPQHAKWFTALEQMIEADCFNEDANSLDLYQGWEAFGRGEAAMLLANDGYLSVAIDLLGEDKVDIMRMPQFDNGPLVEGMCAFSQGLGITSWSPNKELAADFLLSLHEQESVDDFFATTGTPFASRKFNPSILTNPVRQEHFEWLTTRDPVCPEGMMPISVWENGVLPASQAVFQRSTSPAAAAQMVEDTAQVWRDSNPPEIEQWNIWAGDD